MRCNIISGFSNGPELYRFQGYSPTKWDYSLADDGNVTHYPDPPGGYWRKTDAPRFGLSCFCPNSTNQTQRVTGSYCAALNSSFFESGCILMTSCSVPLLWRKLQ
jgi:hypothetical protein